MFLPIAFSEYKKGERLRKGEREIIRQRFFIFLKCSRPLIAMVFQFFCTKHKLLPHVSNTFFKAKIATKKTNYYFFCLLPFQSTEREKY